MASADAGLSDDQIATMLRDSFTTAEADMKARALAEAFGRDEYSVALLQGSRLPAAKFTQSFPSL